MADSKEKKLMLQRQQRMRELQYPRAFANEVVVRNKEVKLTDNEKAALTPNRFRSICI
jgi:hypothetical protein